MRHSHPCGSWRVRFGARQLTASQEMLRSKYADENCPACSALLQGGGAGWGGGGELSDPVRRGLGLKTALGRTSANRAGELCLDDLVNSAETSRRMSRLLGTL